MFEQYLDHSPTNIKILWFISKFGLSKFKQLINSVMYSKRHMILPLMRTTPVAAITLQPDYTNKGHVYIIKQAPVNNIETNQYKIGKTTRTVEKRLKELQTGNPLVLSAVLDFITTCPTTLESEFHKKYKKNRIRDNGEWFNLTADTIRNIEDSYSSHKISDGNVITDARVLMEHLDKIEKKTKKTWWWW